MLLRGNAICLTFQLTLGVNVLPGFATSDTAAPF